MMHIILRSRHLTGCNEKFRGALLIFTQKSYSWINKAAWTSDVFYWFNMSLAADPRKSRVINHVRHHNDRLLSCFLPWQIVFFYCHQLPVAQSKMCAAAATYKFQPRLLSHKENIMSKNAEILDFFRIPRIIRLLQAKKMRGNEMKLAPATKRCKLNPPPWTPPLRQNEASNGNVQRSNATTNIFRVGLNFGADFAGEYQFLHIKFWKNPCKAANKEFLQIATFNESLGPSFHFSPSSSWSCCTQGLVFSMEGTDTTKETRCNCWVAHKIGALICMMPWQHSNGHAKPSN